MTTAKRRTITRLRALAASTTFPEEAASARAKADKLEAELGPEQPQPWSLPDMDASYFGGLYPLPEVSPTMQSLYEMMLREIERRMWERRRG